MEVKMKAKMNNMLSEEVSLKRGGKDSLQEDDASTKKLSESGEEDGVGEEQRGHTIEMEVMDMLGISGCYECKESAKRELTRCIRCSSLPTVCHIQIHQCRVK